LLNYQSPKIGFVVPGVSISGGINVVFQHATHLAKEQGIHVYIIHEKPVQPSDVAWHPNSHLLKFITFDKAKTIRFDIVFATFWNTVYELFRFNSNSFAYFVQSIESNFYKEDEVAKRAIVDHTYSLGLNVITEATWIKDYLKSKYNTDCHLVKNGIRKDLFTINGPAFSKLEDGKIRILVEGPLNIEFKNVLNTLAICKKSQADEIWLLTPSVNVADNLATRVFCRVPINEVPKIMRSCDLLVKLSYVEGMFGPPLEMFHCGGSAIVYSVSGCDEYIIDGFNGVIIAKDDQQGVIILEMTLINYDI
jgi:glycosyltransferase involved in cell wall biosynthesis